MSVTYTVCIECRGRIPAGTGGRCARCALPGRMLRRTKQWRDLSRAVRARGVCDLCGTSCNPADLDAHHRVPVALRPDLALDPSNVVAACRACHDSIPRPAGRRSRPDAYGDRLVAWLEVQRASRGPSDPARRRGPRA